MKRNAKRILPLLLLCALLLLGCTVNRPAVPARETHVDATQGFSPAGKENELVPISENQYLALSANLKTGEAAVLDKQTGVTWYTNPVDKFDDQLASGYHKNALLSALTVVYTTTQSVEMTCGAFLQSVQKDGLYYRIDPDGSIVFLFDFPNEKFRVPIRYALNGDRFDASILTDGILEYGTNKIKSIEFLPYFGAGGMNEDGYLFVPDGSGALIYFNNERLTARTYSQSVYGFDNGTNDKTMGGFALSGYFTLSQNAYMPVFGIHRGDDGFLAIVTEGAARATVNANVSGKYSNYNSVWTTYSYRTIGTVRQTQKDGSEQVVSIGEKNIETYENYTVSYCPLKTGASGYSDMAARYRDYLIEREGLEIRTAQSDRIPLYLDVYGHIEKTKSVLGIPIDVKITTASVKDVNAMLDALKDAGLSRIVLKYNYWSESSFYRKVPVSAKPDGKVGSSAELLALRQRLADSDGGLYLSADLLNIYRSGRGVNQYRDALQSVANTVQRQYAFRLDSAMVDSRYDPWYLLRLGSVQRVFAQYAKNLHDAGFDGAALDTVGEKLYSELGTNGTGRNQARSIMANAVQSIANTTGSVLLTGANEYAANFATHILITPARSSSFDLEDVSIPFYQMVYHGCISYSLRASNLSSNPKKLTLTCIEFGAYPMFSLICENADELIGSRLNTIYSADFSNWSDEIVRQYGQLNEALCAVQTARVKEHRIVTDSVRCIAYDNGAVIWVNYGDAPYSADGVTVPALGFTALLNGQVYASAQAVGD